MLLVAFIFIIIMELLQSALSQGIIPAIVVVVYLIIVKILDNKTNERQIKISNQLLASISNLNAFVVAITKNIIEKDKEKCKRAIEDTMTASIFRLINFVTDTLVKNNIVRNKQSILANIHKIVNTEYYNIYETLSAYVINNHKVSEYLNKTWIDEIEKELKSSIYQPGVNREDKILSFSNKIKITIKEYIIYINNNALK